MRDATNALVFAGVACLIYSALAVLVAAADVNPDAVKGFLAAIGLCVVAFWSRSRLGLD
jgi:hypothetical protein